MIRRNVQLRRDRPRRHEDPGGDRRRGPQGARAARRPTPTERRSGGRREEIAQALREAATAAELEPAQLQGIGVGSPGTIEGGNVSPRATCPAGKARSRWRRRLQARLEGAEFRSRSATTCRSRPMPSSSSAPGGLRLAARRLLGHRRRRRGDPRRQALARAGGAGEIGHMVVEIDGARCTCGRRGCMEAYAGRAAMEIHARKLRREGRHTDLFKLMRSTSAHA